MRFVQQATPEQSYPSDCAIFLNALMSKYDQKQKSLPGHHTEDSNKHFFTKLTCTQYRVSLQLMLKNHFKQSFWMSQTRSHIIYTLDHTSRVCYIHGKKKQVKKEKTFSISNVTISKCFVTQTDNVLRLFSPKFFLRAWWIYEQHFFQRWGYFELKILFRRSKLKTFCFFFSQSYHCYATKRTKILKLMVYCSRFLIWVT